jgi:hydrogenase nickel incorporation protein HypA/HybF
VHEASLAKQILAVVLARATAAGATRVRVVRGWVRESEALSGESLAAHFAAQAGGTVAEGARLDLAVERLAARCGTCGDAYLPEQHVLLCPACGSGQAELLGRAGLGIDAIDVE